MKWTVILLKDKESDFYTALCLELPGCISEGTGVSGATDMIKEAIECHLDGMYRNNIPIPSTETVFDVSSLDEPPDYILTVEVPVPQPVAA